ncbi:MULTISPECIES: hypothetical protein [Arthrobacter]|uniref:Uncharacterized protein n=2 Tax=Arthrobacter terricola TaxID=2547396 RepID=A0A4R5K672_9MICC|nr:MULTISPECIES: hypothetical protein [Arthrobacter]MBT8162895.1 hypothetical protein [Arthrobacter sp. GN70]TDF86443.1 hypothetical protein E1809_25665 [Arthrobacter terricola]
MVAHARDVDRALNSAVRELQTLAMVHGVEGILATKHAPGRFTLELSRDVPYGYTLETHADTHHKRPVQTGN